MNRGLKVLGLHIGKAEISGVLVQSKGRQISVLGCFRAKLTELSTSETLSQEAKADIDLSTKIGSLPSSLQELLQTAKLVSALNAEETLTRTLEIKLKKESEIDAVLAFQAEPLLPYPVEEAVLDKQILAPTSEGMQLALQVVKKEGLQKHLTTLERNSIEPERVITTPLALVALSNFLLTTKPPHFILYLGDEQITCVFARSGKLIASQISNYTLLHLQGKGPVHSESWLKAVEELQREINRIIFSLMKQVKELQVPHIMLTGKGCNIDSLSTCLLQSLQKNMLPVEVPAGFGISLEQLHEYAIPLGAGLIEACPESCQINLRQHEYAYPHPWKQWKKPLYFFFASCLAASFALWFFQSAYMSSKEDELRKQYALLLSNSHITFDDFERNFAYPHVKSAEQKNLPVPDPATFTPADIQERLYALEKHLQATPDLFPLQPNVPRVSDVLAWLATHPKAIDPLTARPLIKLESFNYTMLKRPDNTKKQERYQVKVEFEFSSTTPTAAREFHEALLAPNDFVDNSPKNELKWSGDKGKYKASFILKDKTFYH